MSVLIRGMEMPERCGICPCFHAEWPMYCQAVKADKNKRIVAPYGMPRPQWCPLIELPAEHGRLIDADALKDTLDYYIREAGWSDEINEALTWVRDEFIDHEPTVIEAEGESE